MTVTTQNSTGRRSRRSGSTRKASPKITDSTLQYRNSSPQTQYQPSTVAAASTGRASSVGQAKREGETDI